MNEAINDIIKKCRRNERESQFQLFELFLPYVTSICKRYLRDKVMLEDVVQEVFLLAFKGLKDTYDERRGSFKPWLRKVAINSSLNYNKRYQGFSELNIETDVPRFASEDFKFVSDEQLLFLLDTIPAAYRDVFNLYVIDGYGHQEIASMLGISEGNSRKKLQRARTFLKKILRGRDLQPFSEAGKSDFHEKK